MRVGRGAAVTREVFADGDYLSVDKAVDNDIGVKHNAVGIRRIAAR